MTYTEAHKRATDKWRQNNREEYNVLCRVSYKNYYERNTERVRQQKLDRYFVLREFEIFRRILL